MVARIERISDTGRSFRLETLARVIDDVRSLGFIADIVNEHRCLPYPALHGKVRLIDNVVKPN